MLETKVIKTVTVFGNLMFISIDFYDFISPFPSLVLNSTKKTYQAMKTVFQIPKHLEFRQKTDFCARRVFNSFLEGVFRNVVKYVHSCIIYHALTKNYSWDIFLNTNQKH